MWFTDSRFCQTIQLYVVTIVCARWEMTVCWISTEIGELLLQQLTRCQSSMGIISYGNGVIRISVLVFFYSHASAAIDPLQSSMGIISHGNGVILIPVQVFFHSHSRNWLDVCAIYGITISMVITSQWESHARCKGNETYEVSCNGSFAGNGFQVLGEYLYRVN